MESTSLNQPFTGTLPSEKSFWSTPFLPCPDQSPPTAQPHHMSTAQPCTLCLSTLHHSLALTLPTTLPLLYPRPDLSAWSQMEPLIPDTNSLVLECTSYFLIQIVNFLGQGTNKSSETEYTNIEWPDHI